MLMWVQCMEPSFLPRCFLAVRISPGKPLPSHFRSGRWADRSSQWARWKSTAMGRSLRSMVSEHDILTIAVLIHGLSVSYARR